MSNLRNKIVFFLLFLLPGIQNSCFGEDYWQQFVHYEINVSLDNESQILHGFETLVYQNNSPDTLTMLYFYLYPNAFQKTSVMAKEARKATVEIVATPEEQGWLIIDSLTITKHDLPGQSVNVDTSLDDTLLKITLSKPLLPREQLCVLIKFRTKIRQFNYLGGKGGYSKNLYEVSQWYPKVCVYDDKGWHPIKYHWLGEFYGEFGTYNVTLDVPDSFIVAATGEVVSGDPGWKAVQVDSMGNRINNHGDVPISSSNKKNESSRRRVKFHAENVHDFVWAASPDYLYQTRTWNQIPIHVLFRKSSQKQWLNHVLAHANSALTWLNPLVGDYPYPQLTVCEGLLSGGMEYPMVTILGYADITLAVHEICHQYFYGALANNEYDEGWLDEGIVTYLSEFLVAKYGPKQNSTVPPAISIQWDFLKRQFKAIESNDLKLNSLYYYFYSGFEQPVATRYDNLVNRYFYSYNVYIKPSKIFAMLDYLVGHATFKKILQAYYNRWKFKHVNSQRFQATCERVAGLELDWFFNQWIYTTARLDYACVNVSRKQYRNGLWKTDISIEQLGDARMPVEAEIITEAGDTLRKRCDRMAPEEKVSFSTRSMVKKIELDPDDIILDQNRLNNGSFRLKSYYYPEFLSMYYLPRDAYTLCYWPRSWYNDVDGLKIGIKFLGGYLNRYYITRSYFWYGFRSQQFDFNLGYSMPWESINRNLWRHIYALNIEGRTEVNANLNYIVSKQFAGYKSHSFRLGFSYQNVNDDQYLLRRIKVGDRTVKFQEWEEGRFNKFYFTFKTNCFSRLPYSNIDFNAQISNEKWGSDANFIRLSLKHQLAFSNEQKHWRLKLRNFFGYSYRFSGRMPRQDKFWLAEGNPNLRFKHFYLRSVGSIPPAINYHLPGDGNLRGYLNKLIGGEMPLAADKLISANFDFSYRNIQLILPRAMQEFLQGIDFAIFLDAGELWDAQIPQKAFLDAGFGFRFYKKILGKQRKLRIDFPIFLNRPELDRYSPPESKWKFRWLISFQ